jgi:quercetin dioxygenase-like cupin family protein
MQSSSYVATLSARRHEALILEMQPQALSEVPFHHDTPCITRFTAFNFPLHLGVHQIASVNTPPPEYTEPHVHADHHEVNLIISEQELVYCIRLGDQVYTVTNNACIWIPKGTVHSANLVKGNGYYIALRID